MHLKSIGALCARTLSYESCEFELVDGVSDAKVSDMYNKASDIWAALHSQLLDRHTVLKRRDDPAKKIAQMQRMGKDPTTEMLDDLRHQLDLHRDSDSESDNDDDDELVEETRLRRMYRERKAKILLGKDFDSSLITCLIESVSKSLIFILLLCRRIVLVCSSKILSKSLYCQQGRHRYLPG